MRFTPSIPENHFFPQFYFFEGHFGPRFPALFPMLVCRRLAGMEVRAGHGSGCRRSGGVPAALSVPAAGAGPRTARTSAGLSMGAEF